jgi:hypothetical protein
MGYDVVDMPARLHDVTSQKTAVLIFTSMTSDFTKHPFLITVMRMGLNKFNSFHGALVSPVV